MANTGPNEHQFGVGRGYLTEEVIRVAEEDGEVCAVNYNDPAEGRRHWFTCRNYGEPFNSATAKDTMARLERAGLLDENGKPKTVPSFRKR